MACDTKQNSLNHLRDKNIITDTRTIMSDQRDAFDKENERLTSIASEIYGLDTGGRMLYDIETVEHTVGKDTLTSRKRKTYKATPVDELFEKLDELYDIKHARQEDQIRTVLDRKPESRTAYIGARYKDTEVMHMVQDKTQASKVNKLAKIQTRGFLNQRTDDVLYDNLVREFKTRTGRTFSINATTSAGLDLQVKFYEFVSKKGIKGMEVYDSENNLHLISFGFSPELQYSDTELSENIERDETSTMLETVEEPVKSVLEDKNWYHPKELESIYEIYSPAEVNKMMDENSQDATDVFNKLLYPDEFNNDIFVSDREVNDQVRKCK